MYAYVLPDLTTKIPRRVRNFDSLRLVSFVPDVEPLAPACPLGSASPGPADTEMHAHKRSDGAVSAGPRLAEIEEICRMTKLD
jgi:hypothetical protein